MNIGILFRIHLMLYGYSLGAYVQVEYNAKFCLSGTKIFVMLNPREMENWVLYLSNCLKR